MLTIHLTPQQLKRIREALEPLNRLYDAVVVVHSFHGIIDIAEDLMITQAGVGSELTTLTFKDLKNARLLLADLPPYLYPFMVVDGENAFWYAAVTEDEAKALHIKTEYVDLKEDMDSQSVVFKRMQSTPVHPDRLIPVTDVDDSGAGGESIGTIHRTAEDWANTQGKPYQIATTKNIGK